MLPEALKRAQALERFFFYSSRFSLAYFLRHRAQEHFLARNIQHVSKSHFSLALLAFKLYDARTSCGRYFFPTKHCIRT